MNSAVQTSGTVNDSSSCSDLLILGWCTVSLDLYLKSRRELLSQNCRFQRVSAKPWGKQICSLFFAPFTRWEVLGESPLCFQLWNIHEEGGKLKQEAILEVKPTYMSALTKKLFRWLSIAITQHWNVQLLLWQLLFQKLYFKMWLCLLWHIGVLQAFYTFSSCKCGISNKSSCAVTKGFLVLCCVNLEKLLPVINSPFWEMS